MNNTFEEIFFTKFTPSGNYYEFHIFMKFLKFKKAFLDVFTRVN